MLTTLGTLVIPSGIQISLGECKSKPITPVINKTINVTTATNAVGTVIFNHNGHLRMSIFLILPHFLTTGSLVVSSYIKVSISGLLSSILTFIALRIAFSLFSEIFLAYLLIGSRISLFPFSKYALLSMASGGTCPVIILYKTAPKA